MQDMENLIKKAKILKEKNNEKVYIELNNDIRTLDDIDLKTVKLLTPSMIEKQKDDTEIVISDYKDLTNLISNEAKSYDGRYLIRIESEKTGLYLDFDKFIERRKQTNKKDFREFQKELTKEDFYEDVVIIKTNFRLFDDLEDSIFESRSISYNLKPVTINWNKFVKEMDSAGYKIVYSSYSQKEDPMEQFIETAKRNYVDKEDITCIDDQPEKENFIRLDWPGRIIEGKKILVK